MQADGWEQCAAPLAFRRAQSIALDAVERRREQGACSAYVVLPPGAGKTAVGLEVARRLARRTLVLTPNTAVQGQWLREWAAFGQQPGKARPVHPQPASARRDLRAALTVLTYQGLSVWDRGADDQNEPDGTGPDLAERRRAAVRGEPGADLLSLLHPRGLALVDAAPGLGPWTLVLDECHHLLETWGALVPALAAALGDDTWVLGLTATPPAQLAQAQAELHDVLFEGGDVVVTLPDCVHGGELAPFQELVHYAELSPGEHDDVLADATRFAELRTQLVDERAGSLPLADWLYRRMRDRRLRTGPADRRRALKPVAAPERRSPGPDRRSAVGRVSWTELERSEPALARAGLRLVAEGLVPLPDGARLREEHRVPADAQDWAAALGSYAREHLAASTDPQDAALLARVREVLPSLGWLMTGRGLRMATAPVDRLCAQSPAKTAAALQILQAESQALGDDLRAAVLCDLDAASAPPGSARAAFLALARSDLGPRLRPVLCTGRTVALRRDELVALRAFAPTSLADRLVDVPFEGTRALVSLTAGSDWSARTWVPLITDWLVAGGTQVVVSTRALLGEGWDCPPLNVLVDLSTAASRTTAVQVRGRPLRLDAERPDKVADIWSVACVADGHPHGDADHRRVVTKHDGHIAPGPDGQLEAGIGHCDPALSPFRPPDAQTRAAVTGRALQRPAERAAARARWGVDQARVGSERTVLLVQTGRDLGLPGGVVPRSAAQVRQTLGAPAPAPLPPTTVRARSWPVPAGAGTVAAVAGGVLQGVATATAAGLGVGAVTGGVLVATRYRGQLHALSEVGSTALGQLAAAIADALQAVGETSVGASAVRINDADGATRIELEDTSSHSKGFADALDELLAPLADPRWIVSRLVLERPDSPHARQRLARRRALGRPVEAAVTWHAVPSVLGRRREGIEAMAQAWDEHVGPAHLLRTRDPEGAGLLDLLRAEDPFAVTTRLRTVWR